MCEMACEMENPFIFFPRVKWKLMNMAGISTTYQIIFFDAPGGKRHLQRLPEVLLDSTRISDGILFFIYTTPWSNNNTE